MRGPSYEQLRETLIEAAEALPRIDDAFGPRGAGEPRTPVERDALGALLLATAASMGECRMAVPYSPMHPVRRNDGTLVWCCNHDPEHC